MKEIQNWPGYFVCEDGRIWSEKSKKFLIPQKNAKGYLRVCLSNNSKKKCLAVHRLVAEAYLSNNNPLQKTEINHKDENITNNSVENLEWITPDDNLHYGTRSKRISKTNGKKVGQFSKDGILINIYTSEAEASRSSGISRQGINNCVNGKTKSSGGYIWKRLEDEE